MKARQILNDAVGRIVLHRRALARSLLLPTVARLAVDAGQLVELGFLASLGRSLASLAVQTVVAVTVHRLVLLGPESLQGQAPIRWSRREVIFALYLVLLGLISGVIVGGGGLLMAPVAALANVTLGDRHAVHGLHQDLAGRWGCEGRGGQLIRIPRQLLK